MIFTRLSVPAAFLLLVLGLRPVAAPESTRLPGDFNLPRALFTAAALPENHFTLAPMVSSGPGTYTRVRLEALYAARLGRRGEFEISLPAETVGWVTGRVVGVGDVTVGGKYALHVDPEHAFVLTAGITQSLQTEVANGASAKGRW